MLQVDKAKPKVFEDIYDRMGEMRLETRVSRQEVEGKLETMRVFNERQRGDIEEVRTVLEGIKGKVGWFDGFISEERNVLARMNEKMGMEITAIQGSFEDKMRDMRVDLKKIDSVVTTNQMKVKEFADIIERIESMQRDQNMDIARVTKDVWQLKELKLDADKFDLFQAKITDLVATVKYATQDVFR